MRISDKVQYIGVNDRTTGRFEAMWPLPLGVTYNSYLVDGGERLAIVDGVEVSHALRQIERIKELAGGRRPDYLIINHMEPDHSGAIGILRKEWPELTIVGNAQTLAMVRGFYGEDAPTLTVKDGDTLRLGEGTTLRFVLTPMVHWPETMMTLLEEDGTLFSGDAFGCFGALNGAVVDSDMNTDRYFPEMVRYYSCIVGRYGVFVQRALKRLADVRVATICSTHGPVWRERAAEVVALYDRMSRYEPLDEGATVVYGSMYGNTARLAEAAAEALAASGVKDIEVMNAGVTDLSRILEAVWRHRVLVLAAPTYSDGLFPPVRAVVEALAVRKLSGRRVVLMGTHTWAHHATRVMAEALAGCDVELVAEPVVAKQAPDAAALAAAVAAASAAAN